MRRARDRTSDYCKVEHGGTTTRLITRARARTETWTKTNDLRPDLLSFRASSNLQPDVMVETMSGELLRQYRGYLAQANGTVVSANVNGRTDGPGRKKPVVAETNTYAPPSPYSSTTVSAQTRARDDDGRGLAPGQAARRGPTVREDARAE